MLRLSGRERKNASIKRIELKDNRLGVRAFTENRGKVAELQRVVIEKIKKTE